MAPLFPSLSPTPKPCADNSLCQEHSALAEKVLSSQGPLFFQGSAQKSPLLESVPNAAASICMAAATPRLIGHPKVALGSVLAQTGSSRRAGAGPRSSLVPQCQIGPGPGKGQMLNNQSLGFFSGSPEGRWLWGRTRGGAATRGGAGRSSLIRARDLFPPRLLCLPRGLGGSSRNLSIFIFSPLSGPRQGERWVQSHS